MAKLVNVAVSEAVGVQSLRVRVSLRAQKGAVLLNRIRSFFYTLKWWIQIFTDTIINSSLSHLL